MSGTLTLECNDHLEFSAKGYELNFVWNELENQLDGNQLQSLRLDLDPVPWFNEDRQNYFPMKTRAI